MRSFTINTSRTSKGKKECLVHLDVACASWWLVRILVFV